MLHRNLVYGDGGLVDVSITGADQMYMFLTAWIGLVSLLPSWSGSVISRVVESGSGTDCNGFGNGSLVFMLWNIM